MQPNQQILQSQSQDQILPQNPQFPMNNIIPQNQVHQLIQTENLNLCEKCSKYFTGSPNIPLVVFLILMSSFAYHINSVLFTYGFLSSYYAISSFFDLLFALLVWSKMAIKIELISSTVKYGYLYIVNLLIISIFTLTSPLKRVWNFVLFETILISINNKDKDLKFCCCKIPGKYMIIVTITYFLIFNFCHIFSILFTICYAFIYEKCFINKINISNEKIQRLECNCIIRSLKYTFKTFISLEEVLNREKSKQENNNINNSANMSYIVNNMYPNYYSGIIQGNPNQAPIQPVIGLQQNPSGIPPVIIVNNQNS